MAEKRSASRRWSRVLTALLFLVLLVGPAWKIVEYLVDIDRYRPQIEAALSEATGMAVKVAALDLDVLPAPRLRAMGVVVGEGDFRVEAPQVTARASLAEILDLTLIVTEVRLRGVLIVVPEDLDALAQRIEELRRPEREAAKPEAPVDRAPSSAPEPREAGVRRRASMRVVRVRASGTVHRGENAPAYAVFNVDVHEPLAKAVRVALEASLPGLGDEADLRGDLVVRPAGPTLEGMAEVNRVRLRDLLEDDAAPDALASLRAVFGDDKPDLVGAELALALECDTVEALEGGGTAKAWWEKDTLTVNDVVWRSGGFELAGDVTRDAGGAFAAEVSRVVVTKSGLAWLGTFAPEAPVDVEVEHDEAVVAEDLLFGVTSERAVRLVRGTLRFDGLDVLLEDGARPARGLRGRATIEEGLWRIEQFEGEGISLTGSVEPDFAKGTATIDLHGSVNVQRAQLAPFLPLDDITELEAAVWLDRVAGTFAAGKGVPDDLVVEGRVEEGRIGLDTPELVDTIGSIAATFATSTDSIETNVSARSAKLGDFFSTGRYTFADRTWRGSLSADVERVGSPFLRDDEARAYLEPVLASFGASTFDVQVNAPGPESPRIDVLVTRQGDPPLDGSVTFARADGRYALGALEARTRVALGLFDDVFPPEVKGSGLADVRFVRAVEEQSFQLDADLSACEVSAGEVVHKRAGDAAGVRVTGSAGSGPWMAREALVAYGRESVRLALEEDRMRADDIAVNLASLKGLFVGIEDLSGHIRGVFVSKPLEAALILDGAALRLAPELAIDALTGPVRYADDELICEGMSMRAANSTCTFNARVSEESWDVDVTAEQLDVDALDRLVKALEDFTKGRETRLEVVEPPPPEDRVAETTAPPHPRSRLWEYPPGRLDAKVAKLLVRRAQFEDLDANVAMRDGGVFVDSFSVRPYTGSVTGRIAIPAAAEGEIPYAAMDVVMKDIDLRVLDELAFRTPRRFYGTLTGKVDLRVPVGKGVAPEKDASGHIVFVARDGSFGDLGIATKVLAALRTLEVFRLRLPSFKDTGLTYDVCRGEVALRNGLVDIRELAVQGHPLAMEAKGLVDFPNNNCKVNLGVRLLGGVTGILGRVPGLAGTAEVVDKHTRVVLVIRDDPYDPVVRVAPGESLGTLTDPVVDAAKTGGELLLDTTEKALKWIFNR
ncbi:MAG TPA: hypothetical protein ENN80_00270 [Candidatus Hydrogenedentes bacterium]|nr:hypothetical protein [Candidatus Hydrogenedentota bacterium]